MYSSYPAARFGTFTNSMDNMDFQHNFLCILSINYKLVLILFLIHDITGTQSEVSQRNCQ